MANLTTNLETLRNGKQKVIDSVTAKLKEDPQLTIDCTWDDISDAIDDIEVVPDPVIDPDTNIDLTKLCSRTINESIKVESPTIPDYIFQYQASLPLFKAPNATSVGTSSLRNCTSLTKVDLPEVITINSYAFTADTNLEEVDAPKVTTVNSQAFSGCTKLDTFDFSNVVTISDSAFSNCAFTEVILPSLTSLGTSAFASNTKVTYFSAPNLKSINAYYIANGCSLLEEVNLPELTSSNYGNSYALIYNCPKLTVLNVPKLNYLNNILIQSCSSISTLTVPELTGCSNYTRIADTCTNLTVLNLPKLTQFGNNANTYVITNNYRLKNLNLPKLEYCYNSATGTSSAAGSYYCQFISRAGVETLNLATLKYFNPYERGTLINDCKELTQVNLNNLMVIRNAYETSYETTLIYNCAWLKSVILPSLTIAKGRYTFRGSNNPLQQKAYMEAVVKYYKQYYPNNWESYTIGDNTYRNNYQYLNGPVDNWNSLEPEINEYVWERNLDSYLYYSGIEYLELPKLSDFATGTNDRYMCANMHKLETLILGDGTFIPTTTSLPRYLVYNAQSLTTVVLNYPIVLTASYTITNIFYGCPHLTGTTGGSVYYNYESTRTYYGNPEQLKDLYFYVPDDLVEDYKAATNWSVYADQIKPISELSDLILDAGKTIINEAEFKDDQNLTTVSGTGIVEVRASGFENTTATKISLPNAVAVRDYAFKDSNQLTSLVLKRDSVTSVGEGAFMNTALTSFELDAAITLSKYLFKNTSTLVAISVNNAKYVGEEAFVGTSLGDFSGPNVVRINTNAFKNVITLNTITLPEVKIIDDGAFDETSLTSISLPKVSYIGEYAFANNDLVNISIPLISTIKEGAFANNANLASINLYEVLTVEDDAFDGCTNLTNVTITGYTVPELNNLSTDITLHVRAELLAEYQAKYPNHTIIGDVQ